MKSPDPGPVSRPVVPDYGTGGSLVGGVVVPIAVLVAAGVILIALYWLSARQRDVPQTASTPITRGAPVVVSTDDSNAPSDPSAARRREVLDIYFRQVVPRLDQSLHRKRAASDHAIAVLRQRLEGHRHGIGRFADDVTSWGTRFGVVGRMSRDAWRRWWHEEANATAAKRYVETKFRAHVISERDLQEQLEAAVQQFASDLEADRNMLFADIRLPLRASSVNIAVADEDWARMQDEIMRRGAAIAQSGATDNLVSGLTTVTVSGVAGWAAERVVVQILARVGPMVASHLAASGAAAGGGAMAGGAGGGAGVGSLGGPAGTVVGIGVGLVVGAAIDWWMTDRFKDKLAEQCNRFIDTVRDQLIDGSAEQPGLRAVFDEAVRLSDDAQRRAILDVLLEEIGSPPTTGPVSK